MLADVLFKPFAKWISAKFGQSSDYLIRALKSETEADLKTNICCL